jgi:antitoxin component of MazEF toxin-antitoxin module
MAIARIKKVLKIGGSLAIVLPTSWVKGRIKAGEEMVVIENGDLRIFPVHVKDIQAQHEGESESY